MLQTEAAECGPACLIAVAAFHGQRIDMTALRKRWSVSIKGSNLQHLIQMAGGLGFSCRALRLEPEELESLRCPALLHWNLDHFVVLEGLEAGRARIMDPALGKCRLSLRELGRKFTGIALELRPNESFRTGDQRTRLSFLSVVAGFRGLAPNLGRILVLSLSLQGLALCMPFFSQIVIDHVVVSADVGLLNVLGLSFLLLALLHAFLSATRGWAMTLLGNELHFRTASRLVHHLLRLPIEFFGRRHLGDLMSRLDSAQILQNQLSQNTTEAVVDGVMAVSTFAVMLVYSPRLSLVSAIALGLYLGLRTLMLGSFRRRGTEALVTRAREKTLVMESLRSVQTVKVQGAEARHESRWQNRLTESLNAELVVKKLELLQQLGRQLVFGVDRIVLLWLGARAILAGDLSIGMLVAFLAYKGQFTERAGLLLDRLMDLSRSRVHLDRLADIALQEPEDLGESAAPVPRSRRFHQALIRAERLGFRYASMEPFVFDELDFGIHPGECVALVAPSGFGKSTLIKLLLGLFQPTRGRICVDGQDIRQWLGGYRQIVAGVLQDDQLQSGSLQQNIAGFDPRPDQDRIQACATLAAIHHDICRFPMAYHTRVGDMGAALSGGQRQRILIARALYRQPRILVLDEATSQLDASTENHINKVLKRLSVTRIIAAHRQETLELADRIIDLPSLTM